jgi:hypothetical protein
MSPHLQKLQAKVDILKGEEQGHVDRQSVRFDAHDLMRSLMRRQRVTPPTPRLNEAWLSPNLTMLAPCPTLRRS